MVWYDLALVYYTFIRPFFCHHCAVYVVFEVRFDRSEHVYTSRAAWCIDDINYKCSVNIRQSMTYFWTWHVTSACGDDWWYRVDLWKWVSQNIQIKKYRSGKIHMIARRRSRSRAFALFIYVFCQPSLSLFFFINFLGYS